MIVTSFYPSDPMGLATGGIDSFIRGLIEYSSPNVQYRLVGISTNPSRFSAGRWYSCKFSDKAFEFFPLLEIDITKRPRTRIPLSLHYTLRLRAAFQNVAEGDLFELHRIEPLLAIPTSSRTPIALYMHNDMRKIQGAGTDIMWRRIPSVYFALEKRLLKRVGLIHAVSREALEGLTERLGNSSAKAEFCPTWADTSVFSVGSDDERLESRSALRKKLRCEKNASVILSVGRLDSQKNPTKLLNAFAVACSELSDSHLVFVGDGLLRPELEKRVRELSISERVHFLGIRSRAEIADMMRGSDVFAMTSNYEGMPIALIEALSCGLYAVASAVGEVPALVNDTVNGRVFCVSESESRIASILIESVSASGDVSPQDISSSVARFKPQSIVPSLHSKYASLLSS